MNNVIISQNRHWDNSYKNLCDRDIFQKLIKNLKSKHIQVLHGIRRSGKSSLFKLMCKNRKHLNTVSRNT